MTTKEQCAEKIYGAGFTFFVFLAGGNYGTCKGCVTGTEDTGTTGVSHSIYQLRPNFPVTVQDPADNKQCKLISCDPRLPFDTDLNTCMAEGNLDKIECKTGKNGLLERINFVNYDRTIIKSVDNDEDPNWTTQTIKMQNGERLYAANIINIHGKY